MTASIRYTSTPSWTIRQKLETHQKIRSEWKEDFNEQYREVAKIIAKSIAGEFFHRLDCLLSDPYQKIPTTSDPLKLRYEFSIKNDLKGIQRLCPNMNYFAPFKEWFCDDVNSQKTQNNPCFQEHMFELYEQVRLNLDATLKKFQSKPDNANFHYQVSSNSHRGEPYHLLVSGEIRPSNTQANSLHAASNASLDADPAQVVA